MAQISESYASPGLRMGLLLEDYPKATHKFTMESGESLGLPVEFGGDKSFCVCRIEFGDGVGRPPAVGWKVASSGSPDEWLVLSTKALGRALKRAGYPDDLKDLKALVLWRQRTAEIEAIQAGSLPLGVQRVDAIQAAPGSDPTMRALEAAGTTADHVGADDSPDEVKDLLALVDGLDITELKAFETFCEQIGADPERPGGKLVQLLAWFDPDND